MIKRFFWICFVLMAFVVDAHAVLKEKDLEHTLSVLRAELIDYHHQLTDMADERKEQNKLIFSNLMETMQRANQNALMLYSQKANYVFDMTYACHEATTQYQDFQQQQLPFRSFLLTTDEEIAKYDSLVSSLKSMPVRMMSPRAQTDRNICLTLATNIRNTLTDNHAQISDYIRYYELTEQRLKHLNDYANLRYNEIQTGIFKNGSDDYFRILRSFGHKVKETRETIADKYRPTQNSQWDSRIIFGLFLLIGVYIVVASCLNMLAFRLLRGRFFHSKEFQKKRPCIMMATTTITFAIILFLVRNVGSQNFIIMASDLLIEYAWLLGVILVSLLLRVTGDQIKSAFRIYAPLVLVGFLVIAFRIILIPNELVNMLFPPILLVCMFWQWSVIRRHKQNVPRQDMFYAYISLAVFIGSVVSSWMGYTLMAVQILIWWIMQLTCVLTITCVSRYVKLYGERHGFEDKPISQSWFYHLLYKVLLPIMAVLSVMLSIYWAAGVFNLGDLCWALFNRNFIDLDNLQVSIIKLTMVVNLWFIFSYISSTVLAFMRLHYETTDPTTAASREVMGKNVIQVLVWGVWLLVSLSWLHVSVTWLLAISGGLSTGIGFASKDIIENIYYGASLMAGRIKVGDWIDVDGTMGKVSSISYTSTSIESLAGEVITFQNSQLFAKNYKNLTKNHGYISVGVPFGVAYGSNLKDVTKLVEEAVAALKHPNIDKRKRPVCIMVGMGDSSVDFKVFVWSEAMKKGLVMSDVLKCIYDALNTAGIEIPFPQRDITIKSMPK